MSARLPLTRQQRAALFAGEAPRIYGPRRVVINGQEHWRLRKCPVKKGDVVKLSRLMDLKVVRVDSVKGGGWRLQYEIHDRRDPTRLLRRTPPATPIGPDSLPTSDEIRKDAQVSAYTSNPAGTVRGAGLAVDELTQRRITQQAHDHAGHQQIVNQARRERYELERRLGRAREDAILRGVDISSPIRVIERQIAKIERRVYDGKAA